MSTAAGVPLRENARTPLPSFCVRRGRRMWSLESDNGFELAGHQHAWMTVRSLPPRLRTLRRVGHELVHMVEHEPISLRRFFRRV